MNNQQLKLGGNLSNRIENHKEYLNKLEALIDGQDNIEITEVRFEIEYNKVECIDFDVEYIIFSLILQKEKTLKRIAKLEAEFESL